MSVHTPHESLVEVRLGLRRRLGFPFDLGYGGAAATIDHSE